MIHEVKDLHTELHIEIFGNLLDVIVLEDGEIKVGDAGTDQNISTGITAKIEALWKCDLEGRWIVRLGARGKLGAVRCPRRHVGYGRDGKALRLDVIVGVPGIGEGLAARSA